MSLLRRLEQGKEGEPQRTSGSTSLGGGQRLGNLQARRTAPPGSTEGRDTYLDLKTRVQNRLIAEMDPGMDISKTAEVRKNIQGLYEQILVEDSIVLSRQEKHRLFEQIVAEIIGFGPLQPLLEDESVTEVMVNGPKNIYIERKGKLTRVPLAFENDEHVMRIIDRIVAPLGRRIDESSPTVDARLPDGSRVNAVIPPISLVGPTLTIRLFAKTPFTVQDLINFGTITPEAVQFLKACVEARLNIVVSGGTGSGKTTLLNVLSGFIPGDERIVTIENAAELQLRQEHVVTLESRPPNIEGRGEVTIQNLVVNSLRMRPDRIVVGEIRDGAALDMLQAMNTGHDGSMTTAHSNSPRDSIARIETMTMMAGYDLPVKAIREQIASAVDVIVHSERLRDGSRKVVSITEVAGMEGDVVTLTDLFVFEQSGYEEGKVIGRMRPTGLRPKFMDKIEAAGIHLPPQIFGIGTRR
ncbi:MAG: CpaF family protein [Anaerolineales bacterium]|nr:CpaF family protein [Anaerolineales bacterium]